MAGADAETTNEGDMMIHYDTYMIHHDQLSKIMYAYLYSLSTNDNDNL